MKPVRMPCWVCLVSVLLVGGCAISRGERGALSDIGPGVRPALDSDEAGLWMQADSFEEAIITSGDRVRDERLNNYVKGVVCELSPDYCGDIRVYIADVPYFNAFMLPNGVMVVWTGLLLRAQNEAQLASVLGHELAHYLRRHSLQRWRDTRLKSDMLIFLKLATAIAGVGFAGNIAELVAVGSVLAFSRDQEREADRLGIQMVSHAGYAASEAVAFWRKVLKEDEASDEVSTAVFLSTHPGIDERIDSLDELAQKAQSLRGIGKVQNHNGLKLAAAQWRASWLRSELRKREFKQTQVVLDQLLEGDPNSGELYFFQGELRRLRNAEGDLDHAVLDYKRALNTHTAPPQTYRSVGLLYWKAGREAEASAAFQQYLKLEPTASDRKMIRSYLEQLNL